MPGTIIGIARRAAHRAPMETLEASQITVEAGLEGDSRGAKYPDRQITIMSREAWEAALADVERPDLPWTTRRANLLVEGVELPRAAGGVVRIGSVILDITGETNPCARMDEACPGLLKALHPDWRGGVTCSVVEGGPIALGDTVEVLISPEERRRVLP